ncbi:MAG: hypothetical protein IPI04_02870 [Ignavibacteria bacterium]|nr:hypothetical protein [Ignavibacteria bacterium]
MWVWFRTAVQVSFTEISWYAKAFEMCVTGDRLTAREAKQIGLVNKVVSGNSILKNQQS